LSNRIQVYSDETFCNRKTFIIYAAIWGQLKDCLHYKEEIKRIVDDNRTILGKTFKGFHAYKLNEKNWPSLGSIYMETLQKLFSYLSSGKLNLLISLESMKKYEANAGFLKTQIKALLEDRKGVIGEIFKSLKDEDLPALYHRMDQLIVYLKYKDKMGDDGSIIEFYPDSSGKILSYEDKKFRVSGNLPFEYPLDFYELIRILGDVIARTLLPPDWSKKQQKLGKFQYGIWGQPSNFEANRGRYKEPENESNWQELRL